MLRGFPYFSPHVGVTNRRDFGRQSITSQVIAVVRQLPTHRIHVNGIFTLHLVDFYGKLVGKYNSPLWSYGQWNDRVRISRESITPLLLYHSIDIE